MQSRKFVLECLSVGLLIRGHEIIERLSLRGDLEGVRIS